MFRIALQRYKIQRARFSIFVQQTPPSFELMTSPSRHCVIFAVSLIPYAAIHHIRPKWGPQPYPTFQPKSSAIRHSIAHLVVSIALDVGQSLANDCDSAYCLVQLSDI